MKHAGNAAINLIEHQPKALAADEAAPAAGLDDVMQCLAELQKYQCEGEVFSLTSLTSRGTDKHNIFVFRAQSPESDLVIKMSPQEQDFLKFQREILAQRRLHRHFTRFPDLSVPAVRYVARDRRFFVMDHLSGASAHNAIRN